MKVDKAVWIVPLFVAMVIVSCSNRSVIGEWKPSGSIEASGIKRIEVTKAPLGGYLVEVNEGGVSNTLPCSGNSIHIDCAPDKSGPVMTLVLDGDILTVTYRNKEQRFVRS